MRKLITTVMAVMLLTSCGSEPKSESVATQAVLEVPKDTAAMEVIAEAIPVNPELEALVKLFTTKKELPFQLSAEEIDKTEGWPTAQAGTKALKTKEVSLLAASVKKNNLFMDVEYALKDFYTIDSVKTKGTYKDWAESLDLGQTQRSDVYALYKVETGPSSYVLFWMLDYATVEACPYSWAKTVFATAINKNKTGETIVFAEHSGGGDAPISFDRKIKGSLSQDLKLVLTLREELDEDEPKIELTEGNYELQLSDGKLTFTKEEKKAPRKISKKV